MNVIGGHIVIRGDGGPFYGYGRRFCVYEDPDQAARTAKRMDVGTIHDQLGPLSARPVSIEILPPREDATHV